MRQRHQPPAGQKLMHREAVIGAARDHEAAARMFDSGQSGDAAEAAVAVVDQVVGDGEPAIIADPHHAERAAASGPKDEMGRFAQNQALHHGRGRDPQPLRRADVAPHRERPVAPDRERGDRRIGAADGGEEKAAPAALGRGQRGDRFEPGRGTVRGDARALRRAAVGEAQPADAGTVGETRIDHLPAARQRHHLRVERRRAPGGGGQGARRADRAAVGKRMKPQRAGLGRDQRRVSIKIEKREARRRSNPGRADEILPLARRDAAAAEIPALDPAPGMGERIEPVGLGPEAQRGDPRHRGIPGAAAAFGKLQPGHRACLLSSDRGQL